MISDLLGSNSKLRDEVGFCFKYIDGAFRDDFEFIEMQRECECLELAVKARNNRISTLRRDLLKVRSAKKRILHKSSNSVFEKNCAVESVNMLKNRNKVLSHKIKELEKAANVQGQLEKRLFLERENKEELHKKYLDLQQQCIHMEKENNRLRKKYQDTLFSQQVVDAQPHHRFEDRNTRFQNDSINNTRGSRFASDDERGSTYRTMYRHQSYFRKNNEGVSRPPRFQRKSQGTEVGYWNRDDYGKPYPEVVNQKGTFYNANSGTSRKEYVIKGNIQSPRRTAGRSGVEGRCLKELEHTQGYGKQPSSMDRGQSYHKQSSDKIKRSDVLSQDAPKPVQKPPVHPLSEAPVSMYMGQMLSMLKNSMEDIKKLSLCINDSVKYQALFLESASLNQLQALFGKKFYFLNIQSDKVNRTQLFTLCKMIEDFCDDTAKKGCDKENLVYDEFKSLIEGILNTCVQVRALLGT